MNSSIKLFSILSTTIETQIVLNVSASYNIWLIFSIKKNKTLTRYRRNYWETGCLEKITTSPLPFSKDISHEMRDFCAECHHCLDTCPPFASVPKKNKLYLKKIE